MAKQDWRNSSLEAYTDPRHKQDSVGSDKSMASYLSLIVPDKGVKRIKTALEAHDLLDRSVKISPATLRPPSVHFPGPLRVQTPTNEAARPPKQDTCHPRSGDDTSWFSIPTTFKVPAINHRIEHDEAVKARNTVLNWIGTADHSYIGVSTYNRSRLGTTGSNPLVRALREWLDLLELKGVTASATPNFFLDDCRWTYTLYSPMLLLPSNLLSNESWRQLLAGPLQPHLPELWCIICKKLKVTHIAINKPIPAKASTASDGEMSEPNILRSPTDLTPLHGDFGKANLPPTEENMPCAFWVSTVQNDITQVWAPMYTMFSRGNIGEKTRLLNILPPTSAYGVEAFSRKSSGSSAVDLYAGIGYFAFSYVKAGLKPVLCWELNGWSSEGLKMGAKRNGWTTKVVQENWYRDDMLSHEDHDDTESVSEHLLIFNESNSNAAKRVEALRSQIAPVRHVNCGYLPSSSGSWDVAVQVLDPLTGGWIHAHENILIHDIDRRKGEVVQIFRDLVGQYQTASSRAYRFHVECQHIERVKAYAPSVTHVVFDIALLPDKL
ncbi:MAG: hypothetical protein Q9172_002856 [Xanthocarpia lactea]